jgi:hypothetical protein
VEGTIITLSLDPCVYHLTSTTWAVINTIVIPSGHWGGWGWDVVFSDGRLEVRGYLTHELTK